MLPTESRAAIAALPYLLSVEPHDTLLLVGMDADGTLRHGSAHPLLTPRPLDEPMLECSVWTDDIRFAAAIAYTDRAAIDLQPLIAAWHYRDRAPIHALWADSTRWGSYLCNAGSCCGTRGNSYWARLAAHDDFVPFAEPRTAAWRRDRWNVWQEAIASAMEDRFPDTQTLGALNDTLYDIPVRDALLAFSAVEAPGIRRAMELLLQSMTAHATLGASIPAHTCLAAIRYLEGDIHEAAQVVAQVLDGEEYSLARLLHNGLSMRAPASLLARSFSAFNPTDLLAA